jgi:hypothetical protein
MHRMNRKGLKHTSPRGTNTCFWTASTTSLIVKRPMWLPQAYSGTWPHERRSSGSTVFADHSGTTSFLIRRTVGGEKSLGSLQAVITHHVAINVKEDVDPGSGHWLMEGRPDYTVALIRKFLDGPSSCQTVASGSWLNRE